MKRTIKFLLIGLLLGACTPDQPVKPTPVMAPEATEIPCPGVEPRGLSAGMQAYIDLQGGKTSVELAKEPESTETTASIPHHVRVTLKEGPKCSTESAWWLVIIPDGKSGWIRVGKGLHSSNLEYSAALLPVKDDAVQRDVPEVRKKEAQVRYIVADIELGGADVQKYYEDQVAAKPDDPDTALMKTALAILKENDGKALANPTAFERKPLRGGTSVVDAGTEFVQPGLDILLLPCDRPDPSTACLTMLK